MKCIASFDNHQEEILYKAYKLQKKFESLTEIIMRNVLKNKLPNEFTTEERVLARKVVNIQIALNDLIDEIKLEVEKQ